MHGTPSVVDSHSSVPARITLFRFRFRGRDDVYPRRFESRKTGKSGYSPACANEWVRGICEQPRINCAECDHRRFQPVTDDVIRHLSAHSSEQVARRARARYVLGLSATVTRKDGHHPIIVMQCGPVR
jgi:hypothetical protein